MPFRLVLPFGKLLFIPVHFCQLVHRFYKMWVRTHLNALNSLIDSESPRLASGSHCQCFLFRFSETPFDGNLSSWRLNSAKSMQAMFYEARNFTGQGLSSWTNMGKVADFSYTFYGASSMAANLSTWDTSSGTTMRSMFNEATSFTGGITNWKVDKVIDFTEMYVACLLWCGPFPRRYTYPLLQVWGSY